MAASNSKPPPPLYIALADDHQRSTFRYTRPILQSALQLMGCNPRHAFKLSRLHKRQRQLTHQISKRVFDVTRSEFVDPSKLDGSTQVNGMKVAELLDAENMTNIPFELYKTQTTVVVSREEFLDIVCDALTLYKYVGPNQRADLLLACRIKERKE